ncbi:hypothetical protein IF2G_02082 [Cordyceps javanica]|nr:hypothetical protein IF2G_02082 [Cordyceps javanica]
MQEGIDWVNAKNSEPASSRYANARKGARWQSLSGVLPYRDNYPHDCRGWPQNKPGIDYSTALENKTPPLVLQKKCRHQGLGLLLGAFLTWPVSDWPLQGLSAMSVQYSVIASEATE